MRQSENMGWLFLCIGIDVKIYTDEFNTVGMIYTNQPII